MAKVGDLVRYKGWRESGPLAVVIDESGGSSDFHKRIRVMWLGEEVPVQAKALSTRGEKITTWVHPKNFEVLGEADEIG